MLIELIRHGETALQREHRYQGTTDVSLSPEGSAALRAADYNPELLIVTNLKRTWETAEILFPGVPWRVVPELSEMDFGSFEGRNYQEMEADAAYRSWVDGMCLGRCPGGESKAEFCDRVCGAFAALMDSCRGLERVAIVAHGGTQMAVLERFGLPKRSYYDWHFQSGQGCLADAASWYTERKLTVLHTTDYTKD